MIKQARIFIHLTFKSCNSGDLCTTNSWDVASSSCVSTPVTCPLPNQICDSREGCKDALATEIALRETIVHQPNSEALLMALQTGLFPESLFTAMEEGAKCGLVEGIPTVSNVFNVPVGENLLPIQGSFNCTDGTPLEDIIVLLYDVDDSSYGSSKLNAEGAFEIVLTDPLPGYSPYFLVFTKECDSQTPVVRSLVSTEVNSGNGMSILYVKNPNKVASTQLTVTLTWEEEHSDVDLHIFEPNGFHVYWDDLVGETGSLDRDDRDGWGPEHFISIEPSVGNYQFFVELYSRHRNQPFIDIPWTLTFKVGSKTVRVETGTFTVDASLHDQYGPYEFDPSAFVLEDDYYTHLFRYLGLLQSSPRKPTTDTSRLLLSSLIYSPNYWNLAPPNWFPLEGDNSEDFAGWLYALHKTRDLRGGTTWLLESINDAFFYNWDFWLWVNSEKGEKYFLTNQDKQTIRSSCASINDDLEKALCAARLVHDLYKNNVPIYCRNFAVGFAHALRELGGFEYKFLSTVEYTFQNDVSGNQPVEPDGTTSMQHVLGHTYVAVRIDSKIYIMDAANNIYIQYGIGENQFNLIGSTQAKSFELGGHWYLEFEMTPPGIGRREQCGTSVQS